MELMECQHHRQCGGWCETEEEQEQCLCCDCLEAERESDADDAALAAVRVAVRGYYAALDRREHGGVAQDKAFRAIEKALGMRWIQGASLNLPNALAQGTGGSSPGPAGAMGSAAGQQKRIDMETKNTVWLLTTGSGADGDEWYVQSIHATEAGALEAKQRYEQPQKRANGSTYTMLATVEKWPIEE